ncbi:MAG: SAM-dependent methyltransferase [Nitrospira sp.]|nr:SAM-dependent methyltransferase [Nitrospira sp.]
MAMQLGKVVPFGRSLDEYRLMFGLSEVDLERNIVGVGDGPASFNAEMHVMGKRVVSIDPLFTFSADDIEKQFHAVVDNIIEQVKGTPDDWVWTYHRSPEHLRENRVKVLTRFIADYDVGKRDGRYLVGELPNLEFRNDQFDLALCSHFLFLYSDHFSYEFHLASVLDMLRVAKEVRIFPLMTLTLEPSPYVEPLIRKVESLGYAAGGQSVQYQLQRGGNQMLRITRQTHSALHDDTRKTICR